MEPNGTSEVISPVPTHEGKEPLHRTKVVNVSWGGRSLKGKGGREEQTLVTEISGASVVGGERGRENSGYELAQGVVYFSGGMETTSTLELGRGGLQDLRGI